MSGTRLASKSDRVRGVRLECKARHVYNFSSWWFQAASWWCFTKNSGHFRNPHAKPKSRSQSLRITKDGLVAVRVRPGFEKSYPLNHDDHGKNPFTPVLWYKANALSIFAPLCYFLPDVMSIIRTVVLGTEYNLDQSSNQIFHGVVTLGSMKESRIVQATIPIKM